MVEEAGGKVVDGNGKTLLFNRRETKHHGIVAANEKLTDAIQGLVATVLVQK
jgi:hypothetical protein